MNAELIILELLKKPEVAALTNKVAVSQLPQNSTYPAMVLNIINNIPAPNLAGKKQIQTTKARAQINIVANNIQETKDISAAVRDVLDFVQDEIVAGKKVVSIRYAGCGPTDKDNEAGLWVCSHDYLLHYYE